MPVPLEQTLYIQVPTGRIVVLLSSHLAQRHVAQVRALAREGFYDGGSFYRVVDGFLAQGGDPTFKRAIRTGADSLPAEFDERWSEGLDFVPFGQVDAFGEQAGLVDGMPARWSLAEGRVWLTRCPGALGFARDDSPNSAREAFWIALQDIRMNDRNDTVFGRVIWGMEHVSTMRRTGDFHDDTTMTDKLLWTPITVMHIATDVPEKDRTRLEMVDVHSDEFRAYARGFPRERTGSWYVHRTPAFGICNLPPLVRLSESRE